MESIALSHMYV